MPLTARQILMNTLRDRFCGALLITAGLQGAASAASIPVRQIQGSQHGYIALRTQDGTRIATGDATQAVHGYIVTAHLIFRFRDGSIDEDKTVLSQRGVFRLISDHHVQRGPSFPKPTDIQIDVMHGLVTSLDESGKMRQDHLDLPPDVANGLPPNLMLNILPSAAETEISFVIPAKKPRLIHISVRPAGMVAYSIGDSRRKAIDYVLHINLGGLAGLIAPIIGKQPADYHIWIAGGAHPAFIREEGQFYEGGPIWRVEQLSPAFSH